MHLRQTADNLKTVLSLRERRCRDEWKMHYSINDLVFIACMKFLFYLSLLSLCYVFPLSPRLLVISY